MLINQLYAMEFPYFSNFVQMTYKLLKILVNKMLLNFCIRSPRASEIYTLPERSTEHHLEI